MAKHAVYTSCKKVDSPWMWVSLGLDTLMPVTQFHIGSISLFSFIDVVMIIVSGLGLFTLTCS